METQNLDLANQEQQNPETQNLDLVNPEQENMETQNETGEASLLGDRQPGFTGLHAAPNRHPLNQGQNLETVNPKSGFPVFMLAIRGSAILVSGIAAIVVFAVFAKRRKGKTAKP